ncbi:DUF2207 domain-containing protein [Candidatus Gottesmanbacteria bacterium]|nr:DUF2207 domain-containing protein [Candidatus Gottesmanbacteria bacterium]
MNRVYIILVYIFLLFSGTVAAQEEEHIQNYDVAVAIRSDGSIRVTERIGYFFLTEKHGIYRNIPVTKMNTNGKRFAMTISDISVEDDLGQSYTYQRTGNGNIEVLKIGDADKTLSGLHEYVLTYTLLGALTYFPGHDELNWNFVGNQWDVPIAESGITVTVPQSITRSVFSATCFVGLAGAMGKDCEISFMDNSVTVKVSRPLASHEGATVVIGIPKGIASVLEPKEVVPFFSTLMGKITLIIFGIVALLWYVAAPVLVIRKWWTTGRDPKPAIGEARAWYGPPKTKRLRELTPAETGTLVDESADMRDVYATLVDLARRGYMKIIETKNGEFDFEKQRDWRKDKVIQPFEAGLLSSVFKNNDLVSMKSLDLHSAFEAAKVQLYEALVSEGFFPNNPQKIRMLYNVLSGFAFVTGNLMLALVALIFGRNMPKKTLFGAEQSAIGKSLRNFLLSQDRHLAFQAKNQMMFEKLLPYAVAFGVEEIWAGRFKGIALKQPDWYVSSTGERFNSALFVHSIKRAANTSFAASVVSKSSRGFSSGFSGGSSGSGGGGGGGGSW